MGGERVPLTAADIAAMAGGRVVAGDTEVAPTGFSIDSRSITTGDAFFAIVAARNGHAFVGDAVARGAAVVVVSQPVEDAAAAAATVVGVSDTTRALQDVARQVRRRSG
ncbi:MAG: Mur ligase domain-containing protein, partial [Acidobacteriota bacterium]|nr:Mur ligase domain-containing protein [Acidobacteriota bacterium]